MASKAMEALQLPADNLGEALDSNLEVEWVTEEEAPLGWAFRGPGNLGADSVMFLTSTTGKVMQFMLQSKPRQPGKANMLRYAFSQARSNLERHGLETPVTMGEIHPQSIDFEPLNPGVCWYMQR